ncbi:MAG: type II toxin-antitoxin system RelE/ParE family toxin [Pseudomonadota bacterium]
MVFLFHPEAETEFLAAVDWYEERSPALGASFAAEIRAAILRAVAMPTAWPCVDGEIRRVLANRFPYGILYAPRPNAIYILAVMHLKRRPDYWRERL